MTLKHVVKATAYWPAPEWLSDRTDSVVFVRRPDGSSRAPFIFRGEWDQGHLDPSAASFIPDEVRAEAERLWETNRPLAENEVRISDSEVGWLKWSPSGNVEIHRQEGGFECYSLDTVKQLAPHSDLWSRILDWAANNPPLRVVSIETVPVPTTTKAVRVEFSDGCVIWYNGEWPDNDRVSVLTEQEKSWAERLWEFRELAENECVIDGHRYRFQMKAESKGRFQELRCGSKAYNRESLVARAEEHPDPNGWPRALAYFDRKVLDGRPLAENETLDPLGVRVRLSVTSGGLRLEWPDGGEQVRSRELMTSLLDEENLPAHRIFRRACLDYFDRHAPLAENEFTPFGNTRFEMCFDEDGKFRVRYPGTNWLLSYSRERVAKYASDDPIPNGWPRALDYFDRHSQTSDNQERPIGLKGRPRDPEASEDPLRFSQKRESGSVLSLHSAPLQVDRPSPVEDERDIIRMELWSKVHRLVLKQTESHGQAVKWADQAVANFNKRFPCPHTAKPVKP